MDVMIEMTSLVCAGEDYLQTGLITVRFVTLIQNANDVPFLCVYVFLLSVLDSLRTVHPHIPKISPIFRYDFPYLQEGRISVLSFAYARSSVIDLKCMLLT